MVISDWQTEYNHDRRYSPLGYLAPANYARQCTHQMETDDSHNVRTSPWGAGQNMGTSVYDSRGLLVL